MMTAQVPAEGPATFETVWAALQETDRLVQELILSQKETAREMKKTDREMKESARRLESIGVQLGGIANNNGEFAEEYFAGAMKKHPVFAGRQFDEFGRKVTGEGKTQDEFDIVLYSETAIAIIEVKYRAHIRDLEPMITEKAPRFRALFPEYANHEIYLGIGSMSFYDDVIKQARSLGIGILRLNGETIEDESGPVRAY
jgi:hypothetical protein